MWRRRSPGLWLLFENERFRVFFHVRCVTQIRFTWLIDRLRGEWSDSQLDSTNLPISAVNYYLKTRRDLFVWSVQVLIVCVELSYLVGSIIARCWRPRTRRYASESLRGTPFKYPAIECLFIWHWIYARVRRGREGNIIVLTHFSFRHYCFILSKTCLNKISTFTTRRPRSSLL